MPHIFLICLYLFATSFFVGHDASAAVQVEFEKTVREGFQNNFGIRLQNLAVEKASSQTLQASGYTIPYFSFDLTSGDGVDPTDVNDGTNIFETNFVIPTSSGVNLYTGGHLESSEFLFPDYPMNNYGGWVGIRLPLLRGLGEDSPANAAIRSANFSHQASTQALSNEVMGYFRDLLSAYLSLKRDTDQYAIQSEALQQAGKYKDEIYELIKYEELPKVEKNRADLFVIQQEQQLNSARLNALNSYYTLRLLTGVADQELVTQLPEIPTTIPDPDLKKIHTIIEKYSSINDAVIMETPIYKNIKLLTEASKVQLDNAKNQKLDQVTLDLRTSWFALTHSAHYAEAFKSDYPGASVLLTLNYMLPVKNNQQEGAYLAQLSDYRSNQINLQKLLFETKTQIQRILGNLEQLATLYMKNKELVEVRKKSWFDEIEKFKMGSSTQIDIINSFEIYIASTVDLNNLKFKIHDTVTQLKFLVCELPTNEDQLSTFSLDTYFSSL